MPNEVRVVFTPVDQFTPTIDKMRQGLGQFEGAAQQTGRNVDTSFACFKGQLLYDFFKRGVAGAIEFGKAAVAAYNEVRAAQQGLESVARFKGIVGDVSQTVRDLELVKNGLLTVGEASKALQALLTRGFNLEQSVTLLRAFGDNAAFGGQMALSLSERVVSQAEGLKQLNNHLLDNGGVTKNLSVLLKEQGLTGRLPNESPQSARATRTVIAHN